VVFCFPLKIYPSHPQDQTEQESVSQLHFDAVNDQANPEKTRGEPEAE